MIDTIISSSTNDAINIVGSILEVLGIILLARYVWIVWSWIWLYFLRPATNLAKYGANPKASAEHRAWALVTGSSEGVGLGFARVLAEKGFNVVLSSRREKELNECARELEREFGTKTRVLVADAALNDEKQYDEMVGQLQELDLAVLVNNVGLNTPIPTSLQDNTLTEIDRMIDINARFPTKLTRRLIPLLARRHDLPGQRAVIVNVSSISMTLPGALLAVYAATKAYNNIFSHSMSAELAPLGIDCLAVTPGYVLSKSNPIKQQAWNVVTAEYHAQSALSKIGYAYTVNAVWSHSLMEIFSHIMPESVTGQIVRQKMEAERERMLREREEHKSA